MTERNMAGNGVLAMIGKTKSRKKRVLRAAVCVRTRALVHVCCVRMEGGGKLAWSINPKNVHSEDE